MTLSLEKSLKDDAVVMAREMGINNLSGLIRHLLIEQKRQKELAMRPLSPSVLAAVPAAKHIDKKKQCKDGKHCGEKLA